MPKICINETTVLVGDAAQELFDFLKNQTQQHCHFFMKNTIDPEIDCIQSIFGFAQNVLVQGLDEKTQSYEIDFIGEQLGEGSFGVVYDISSRVFVTQNAVNFAQADGYSEQQVVKIANRIDKFSPVKMEKHSQLAQLFPHLGMKELVFDRTIGDCVVMKKLPGRELFAILVDEIEQGVRLTLEQRVRLTGKLLEAFEMQVGSQIVHCDIKPENVLVDLETMTINFIDCDMAHVIPAGEDSVLSEQSCGSAAYMPAELLRQTLNRDPNIKQAPSRDIFALARILTWVWGGADASFNVSLSYRAIWRHVQYLEENSSELNNLFNYLPDDQCVRWLCEDVRVLLLRMYELDEGRRINIAETRARFMTIEQNFDSVFKRTSLSLSDSGFNHLSANPDEDPLAGSDFFTSDVDFREEYDQRDFMSLATSVSLPINQSGRSSAFPAATEVLNTGSVSALAALGGQPASVDFMVVPENEHAYALNFKRSGRQLAPQQSAVSFLQTK